MEEEGVRGDALILRVKSLRNDGAGDDTLETISYREGDGWFEDEPVREAIRRLGELNITLSAKALEASKSIPSDVTPEEAVILLLRM